MDEMTHFDERGYVVMKGLLDPQRDLQPVFDEYADLANHVAERLLEEGRIASYDRNRPVLDRLHHLLGETKGSCFQHFDISLPMDRIAEDTPVHLGPAVFDLIRNPRLLDAVSVFIGPDIFANPVQHTRIKLPERHFGSDAPYSLMSKTFWHQDLGVISEEAERSNIVTAFIAVTPSTEANGCVIVAPGSHKRGLVHHCRTVANNGIPEASVGSWNPIIMDPGDVLFFHKETQHASLPNFSETLRWSFDLRYGPIGQPTGRRWFPGFVARSAAHPDQELSDHAAWVRSWHEARSQLAAMRELPKFTRWPWDPKNPAHECPVCAANASAGKLESVMATAAPG